MIIIHRNRWHWGRKHTIVANDGASLCQLSVEDDNPSVAWLSDVIVAGEYQQQGYGNELLSLAKMEARQMGAHMLCLWASPDGWVIDWYKRHGFRQTCVYDDGMVGLTFDLDDGCV